MCGIVGYCGPAKRFSRDKLGVMLRAIEHRGPDDWGEFCGNMVANPGHSVWLGSRRLAILDLSPAGHQPMVDPATGKVIAFNGEIYNFLDIREELEREGHTFRSRCDTEVALRSWAVLGNQAIKQWRGMFAAALWDPQKEELWLVRDHWGIKPLYYYVDGSGLAFASELRALLAAGVAAPRLSRRGLEDYLQFGAAQDPVTMIDGVYALLPGHTLRWSRGSVETFSFLEKPAPVEDGGERVEPMLREIVRQQLVSDVPVVVFLSGGVDSSVVSLLARQEAGSGVNTMSVVFEEDEFSERDFARRLARHIGTQHHEVMLKGKDALEKTLAAVARMDQPTVDGINVYAVSEAARKTNFTVALSGTGGDEFFGGYPTFHRTAQTARVLRVARRTPKLARLGASVLGPAFAWSKSARKLGQYLRDGNLSEHPYFLQRTLFLPSQVAALCRAGNSLPGAVAMAEARRRSLEEEAAGLDLLNQVSLFEARCYMGNTLLRDSDQMSMAHSLELRVPLVDQRLADYLLAVPSEQKGLGRTSKLWLRRAFSKNLPAEVFTRKKMGFTLPFEVWLRGPLASEVESTLKADAGRLWEPSAALSVWRDFERGRLNWSRPWALYVMTRWANQHVFREAKEESHPKALA